MTLLEQKNKEKEIVKRKHFTREKKEKQSKGKTLFWTEFYLVKYFLFIFFNFLSFIPVPPNSIPPLSFIILKKIQVTKSTNKKTLSIKKHNKLGTKKKKPKEIYK